MFQGQFEGTIHSGNGTYHVESMHRYDNSKSDHHSIIYHENDVGRGTFCFIHRVPVGSVVTSDCLKCVWGRNVLKLWAVWAYGNVGRKEKKGDFLLHFFVSYIRFMDLSDPYSYFVFQYIIYIYSPMIKHRLRLQVVDDRALLLC